jgi:hypothetical protein
MYIRNILFRSSIPIKDGKRIPSHQNSFPNLENLLSDFCSAFILTLARQNCVIIILLNKYIYWDPLCLFSISPELTYLVFFLKYLRVQSWESSVFKRKLRNFIGSKTCKHYEEVHSTYARFLLAKIWIFYNKK